MKDLVSKNQGKRQLPARKRQGDDAFSLLHREVNRMFDEFSQGFGPSSRFWPKSLGMPEGPAGTWMPTVDVAETDGEVQVTAELPGMDEKDVRVELSDNALTLSGEKTFEKEEETKNLHRGERSYGSFRRTFPLPAEVDGDKVQAVFKKGVLTVTLPKTEPAPGKVKKVAVKAG